MNKEIIGSGAEKSSVLRRFIGGVGVTMNVSTGRRTRGDLLTRLSLAEANLETTRQTSDITAILDELDARDADASRTDSIIDEAFDGLDGRHKAAHSLSPEQN
ncbi:MAG TPA: hypothetical protein VHC21_03780 [Candidatus Saccharimonadales bacterium]|nr:hypothetical protein [Candidatus Saccharimonadales bacterium]